MKICHFTPTFFPKVGGAEAVVHYLAKNLSLLNQEVTVLCPFLIKKNYLTNYKIRKLFPLSSANSVAGKGFPALKKSSSIVEWLFSASLLFGKLTNNFDIIHSHFLYPCGFATIKIKKFLKTPIICTPHGGDIQVLPEINYGLRLNPKLNLKIINTIKKIDAFISINPAIKKELIKCGAEENTIFEVPNGVDVQKFITAPKIDIKTRYKIDKSKKIILSVGRNSPVKGYGDFLKILPKILKENKDFLYIILGLESTKLLPLINKLHIQDNVRIFEGIFGTELINFYRSADIFLSPSKIEGLALVYLEALAAGLPIIATKIPAVTNVVINEKNGYTVLPKDYSNFVEPILNLLSNDKAMELMGKNSRALADRYDWKKIAKKHLEIYRKFV